MSNCRPYIGFYNGKTVELKASGLYEAKQEAVRLFGVNRRQASLVSVVLADVDHSPAELGS